MAAALLAGCCWLLLCAAVAAVPLRSQSCSAQPGPRFPFAVIAAVCMQPWLQSLFTAETAVHLRNCGRSFTSQPKPHALMFVQAHYQNLELTNAGGGWRGNLRMARKRAITPAQHRSLGPEYTTTSHMLLTMSPQFNTNSEWQLSKSGSLPKRSFMMR